MQAVEQTVAAVGAANAVDAANPDGTVRALTPTQVLRGRRHAFQRRAFQRRLACSLACTGVVTVLAFAGLFGLGFVRGDSMRPAYRENDLILFLRVGGYHRGDAVILGEGSVRAQKLIKRIVGLPGDTVDMDAEGRVLINGQALEEPYASGPTRKREDLDYPLTLGGDEYFVLGDNRAHSSDSRSFGVVAAKQIDGRVIAMARGGG